MVVDAAGRIRFLHRSQTTTDVPKTDALLAALDRRGRTKTVNVVVQFAF